MIEVEIKLDNNTKVVIEAKTVDDIMNKISQHKIMVKQNNYKINFKELDYDYSTN